MDHHGGRISRSSPRPPGRNPRHRIPHSPLLRSDALPAPTLLDRKEASPVGTGLRPVRSRLEQKEVGRQRVGITVPRSRQNSPVIPCAPCGESLSHYESPLTPTITDPARTASTL